MTSSVVSKTCAASRWWAWKAAVQRAMSSPWPIAAAACTLGRSLGLAEKPRGSRPAATAPEDTITT
jgi:hypothetical protein